MPSQPSNWQRIKYWKKNILAGWEEQAFEYEFVSLKLVNCRIFLCNTPEAVQFAFSLKNANFERKSAQMRHALEPLIGDGLFISDGDTWRKRRRIVAPIVHMSRLPEFAPVMVETALRRATAGRGWNRPPIDALAEMAHLTAEIICRTIFGRQLGRDHADEMVDGFSNYQRVIDQIDIVSLLGSAGMVSTLVTAAPFIAPSKRIHAVLDGIIESYRTAERRRRGVGDRPAVRCARRGDRRAARPEALRNEAAVLFMAGHETTANTLAWAGICCRKRPRSKPACMPSSMRAGRTAADAFADLPSSSIRARVLEETLRLYPPVPILPREALRGRGLQEPAFPKARWYSWSLAAASASQTVGQAGRFRRPSVFCPAIPGRDSKFAYIPFSIGPRICAGMSFGQQEAILCLATLAQTFRLRLKPGHEIDMECHLTLRPGKNLPMNLHRRAAAVGNGDETPAMATACPAGRA